MAATLADALASVTQNMHGTDDATGAASSASACPAPGGPLAGVKDEELLDRLNEIAPVKAGGAYSLDDEALMAEAERRWSDPVGRKTAGDMGWRRSQALRQAAANKVDGAATSMTIEQFRARQKAEKGAQASAPKRSKGDTAKAVAEARKKAKEEAVKDIEAMYAGLGTTRAAEAAAKAAVEARGTGFAKVYEALPAMGLAGNDLLVAADVLNSLGMSLGGAAVSDCTGRGRAWRIDKDDVSRAIDALESMGLVERDGHAVELVPGALEQLEELSEAADPKSKCYFYQLWSWCRDLKCADKRLRATHLLLICKLINRQDATKSDVVYLGYDRLAKAVGLKEKRAAKKAMTRLQELGYVVEVDKEETAKGGRDTSSHWVIRWSKIAATLENNGA